MLKSSLLLLSFLVLAFFVGFHKEEVEKGKLKERYSAKVVDAAMCVMSLYYALALTAWGSESIIRFSDKWVIQTGDSPVWSLIFVAPVAIFMLTAVAFFAMSLVCAFGMSQNRRRAYAYRKRRRLARRAKMASK